MEPSLKISIEESPDPEELKVIGQGMQEYNRARVGENKRQSLHVLLRDEDGTVIGGLSAATSWQWLYVSGLWVHEKLRGQGYGGALMKAAEEEAVRRGCKAAYLDTFDFQAPEFYKKIGYTAFGEVPDFPPGHTRYFFTKKLAD